MLDLLECRAHLDNTEADHTRIKLQRPPDRLLNVGRAVEPHDEMLAFGVALLMLCDWFGEHELAPVRVVTDDAAAA